MKRVGFLTTFCDVQSGYSLIAVAETQIKMLIDHGYDPVVLVQEGERWQADDGAWHFKPFQEHGLWSRRQIDLRPVVPWRALVYGDDLEGAVSETCQALASNLSDMDVCITHDIVLQEWFVAHNVAMRRYAATRDDLTWLHWLHSCPMPRTESYPHSARFTPPPGYVVYPNATDVAFPIRAYRLAGQEWRALVHRHTLDPLAGCAGMTRHLVQASDFLDSDIRCIYPVRLDRGKQPERIIDLLAGCEAHGRTTKLLVCDWQSQGDRFQAYIKELADYAQERGVSVAFTSRLHDGCSQGVPRDVVLELFGLCNVYVHPSRAETYSLTVHEAMQAGCLCVLNHDFPAMRELFGENAIYVDFGSDRFGRPDRPEEWWADEAMRVIAELERNRVLAARNATLREWTPDQAWREFERMLYLEPVAGEGGW